ncbi:MAG: adenosylmethionine--8-amino-7-oxononanoate transaminase, partial [Bacteroidia bacterium]
HPFTQMKNAQPPIAIVRAEGTLLFDENCKTYIDAVSSWWVNLHGHSHPYIAEKVSEQLKTLEHVIFAGFTHKPAINLAEKLLEILPQNQARIFYSDNGSTAVEVALKMALQYWFNAGTPRKKIIAFENAYHGDTFGAMSVSGRDAFTQAFHTLLFDVEFIAAPEPGNEETSLNQLRELIAKEDFAAFIFEPLIQGTAGMRMHDPQALNALIDTCKQAGIITIADEVMTGFGRTGKLFASHYLQSQPDLICLSKGLTGGTMPMGVTSCTNKIYEAFLSEDKLKTFFHGHSYTANPLACTAALASIDLLSEPGTQQNIRRISEKHASFLGQISTHPLVTVARQTGTILAIEIKTGNTSSYFSNIRDCLYNFFLDKGILLRPLGNIIYILPPYCITDQQLDHIYESILEVLHICNEKSGN